MSELIDSIFDIEAISKEVKKVESELEGLKTTISTYSAEVKKMADDTRKASSGGDLAKQTKAINDAMVDGTKIVTQYTAVEKELINQKKQLETIEAKRAAANSAEAIEIQKKNKQLKEEQELLKLNTILNDQNTGSLERAEAENKKLQIEKRKLNLETAEGRERLLEINAIQDRNNELTASARNEDQKRVGSIGEYGSAFKNLGSQLLTGQIGLKAFAQGIGAITKSFFVLLFSPPFILLAIGAIVGAFMALWQVFKGFAPLIDKIQQGFAGLSAAWSVLKNSLGQFLSGNQSLKESMGGVGSAMKEAAKDAAALKKADQDLEDTMGGLEIANKKLETQMKQLILQSKNKTLSEKEQIGLIDQAIALENQQFENKKKLNDEDLRISFESIRVKNKLNADQYAKLKELGVDYAEELLDQGVQIERKDIDRLKAALLNEENNKQESIGIVEKAMARKDALEEKAVAEELKRREKVAAEAEKAEAKKVDDTKKALDAKRTLLDSELALMADGENKQIAQSKEGLTRRLEDLKANGQLTTELEANLTAANAIEVQKIRDDFAQQRKDKELADFEARLADFEKSIQAEAELLAAGLRQKETNLKKEYSQGLLTREQYEERLLKIQSDALKEANDATIAKLQEELGLAELSVDKRAELSAKLRDLQLANENAVLDATIDANEKKVESEKDVFEKRLAIAEELAGAGMELFGAIGDFQAQQSENRLAEIDAEQSKNDEYFAARQENLDKSIMSEENRNAVQKQLDDEKAKREKAIEDKKRAEQIKAAKWEKAQALVQAVINTALAAVKMFADTGPLGFVLAALSTAAGAVSIATIASQKIPAFEHGGITGDGLALWGEARPEVAVTPSGYVMFAENPTVSKFDAGTRIFKSVEDFEKNMTVTRGENFKFDYQKMADAMPKHSFELNGNGSWTMIDKENNRRTAINRKIKLN